MTLFRNILFPVDFSDHSVAMRHDVEFMARTFAAKLTLLHALPPPRGVELLGEGTPAPPEARREAAAHLSEFAASMSLPIAIQTMIVDGDAAGNIVEFAKRHAVDLVMMPTRGFGAFRRFLIGSVTAKVLHDLHCAVWTSAHAELPHGPIPQGIRAILCAVDLTESDEGLIRRAHDLAVFFSARLHLFHAVSSTPLSTEGFNQIDFRHFLLQSTRNAIANLQQHAGTDYPVEVAEGNLIGTLSTAVRQYNADLLVIGRGHLAQPLGQFRTNAHAIVRASPCPVLSF
ncbi:MAG TPA: universal stress protein [Bryobacteraceae bacterium]|nr:universal stress protein [Bryobacteraceae bacterium]